MNCAQHTNVEQNCAIFLLLDNVVLEDLVVQGLWGFHSRRHGGYGQSESHKWAKSSAMESERRRGQNARM
jgi:hypothetical protein